MFFRIKISKNLRRANLLVTWKNAFPENESAKEWNTWQADIFFKKHMMDRNNHLH